MTTVEQLEVDKLNAEGKPIFVANVHRRFAPSTDRELTDQEKLAWKSFQLWRTTQSIERRDAVYKTIINSDFTNFNLAYHILGTPYPVVDYRTNFVDCTMGIRWYEHLISVAVSYGYAFWVRSKASRSTTKTSFLVNKGLICCSFLLSEIAFCYRSMFRLSGFLPNDYECRKYGVLEDKERLEKKKEIWERYTAYKKEWCRRFDYHVYGIHPGDNWNLFSACWIPAWETSFNTKTDYPPRKNPYFLTATPLRDKFVESANFYEVPTNDNIPLIKARPELKYIYRGPLDALANRKEN
ncbi:unnamed protein product [Phytomonas sp. Hart1]|nr:unnamed protein product [Phytomonas sp. Hart1]|eukprot:CCW68775.1 unnamed protein product [Phytomonas sp. isolate Hart1]